jgi:hypothetical protein
MMPAAPGDVLAVWTGSGITQDLIRIGDVIEGKPAVANHVIGVTHQDAHGRWMGLEGRPGGFGLADCTPYLNDNRTRSNHGQARTADQNKGLLAGAAQLTGTPYDWVGISEDLAHSLDLDALQAALDQLWRWPTKNGLLPGHVVCSSAWAWIYHHFSLACPEATDTRICTPGDWWQFNDSQAWRKSA